MPNLSFIMIDCLNKLRKVYDECREAIRMSEINRADIKPGVRVMVVQKQDQRSGKLTEGIVRDILTNSSTHPHGIKVRLESGIVGRVKELMDRG